MKSFLKSVLLVFTSAVFVFIGVELLLRISKPKGLQYYRDVKLLHAYHPEYGVTLQKKEARFIKHYASLWQGQFTTNSLGIRGTKEADPNSPKLLCLGDSMVMGFGVSDHETFCSLLDGIKIGDKVHQSLNLGVDAYGSLGYAKRLEDILQQIDKPKEVLVFISPNDFAMPEVLRKQGILPDDELDALHENDPTWKRNFKLQFEATRVSYVLQALKLSYEQSILLSQQTKLAFFEELNQIFFQPDRYLWESFFLGQVSPKVCRKKENQTTVVCPEPIPVHEFTCIDKAPNEKDLPPLPDLTKKSYDRLYQLSLEKGFRLHPVFIPVQVEEIYCHLNGKYHPLGNYSLQAKAYWKTKSVHSIDLTDYTPEMCGTKFEEQSEIKLSKIRDFFIPGDGHLTKLGNEWVAKSLKTELGKLK
ncbi:hypothetical protein LPTSP4_13510 [Leptospira ryugenii]|uniref:Lipase n=1 Tax=Leptospira ryugenii TaxID=1917863 RepID=A0A2P2DYX7_9LEPT|nr:SGNH/GDSL hydrolase family protein [Leptospira ryugenii]GBF49831.1 hypothetical protein LPTSP4_13510 [Leptospira ryugenii]